MMIKILMIVMTTLTITKNDCNSILAKFNGTQRIKERKNYMSFEFIIPIKYRLLQQRFPSLNLLRDVFPTVHSKAPELSIALIFLLFFPLLPYLCL